MSEVQPSEHDRKIVLEGAAQLLADGKPRNARDIAIQLREPGFAGLNKALVNSVLTYVGE